MTSGNVPARRPLFRARAARFLRGFSGMPGWQALVNRVVPHHDAPFVIRNGKNQFAGDIGSFIDRQVYLFGGYDTAMVRSFIAYVPAARRGLILDVGANAGTHAISFGRVFRAVHSFEPNRKLWSQFERNMSLNGLANVSLHKIGLADRDAELTLHVIDKPNHGLGTFSTVEQYDLPLKPLDTCSVKHAGSYLAHARIGTVDAVKIDVQGFEPEVLRGLHDVLARDRPVIWCEVAAGTRTKMSSIEDLSALVPYGFRCLGVDASASRFSRGVRLVECSGALDDGDYLIIPR